MNRREFFRLPLVVAAIGGSPRSWNQQTEWVQAMPIKVTPGETMHVTIGSR